MRKIIFVIIIIMASLLRLNGQDVLASISVSAGSVEGTDRTIYDAMQKSLTDMVNGRSWTPYQLKPDERFKIRLSINITKRISDQEFEGTITVVMGRPIYNTNYESPILNLRDNKLHFQYNQHEPMEFIENVHTSNLVAVVAYYIYYGLGMSFDTFQPSGGSEFFSKANNIVQSAQSSQESGWSSSDDDKGRYWMVEYITNPTYRNLRTFMYQYHRQGLDIMADNVENARTQILRALEDLRKAYQERPGMYITQVITDTKRDEIINIFKPAPESEKTSVINIMKQVDASNSSKYEAMNGR